MLSALYCRLLKTVQHKYQPGWEAAIIILLNSWKVYYMWTVLSKPFAWRSTVGLYMSTESRSLVEGRLENYLAIMIIAQVYWLWLHCTLLYPQLSFYSYSIVLNNFYAFELHLMLNVHYVWGSNLGGINWCWSGYRVMYIFYLCTICAHCRFVSITMFWVILLYIH